MRIIEDDSKTLGDRRIGMRGSHDPRAARTRQAILDAVERLDGRSVDEVTVSSIVRAAGISRSSFYTHFSGIDDLAVTILGRAFEEIGTDDLKLRRIPSMTGAEASRSALVRLTNHLNEHRGLYVAVFGLPSTSQVFTKAVELYASHAEATFALLPDIPAGVDRTTVATYVAGGTLTVVSAWLRSDEPAEPAALVEQLFRLLPSWLAFPH